MVLFPCLPIMPQHLSLRMRRLEMMVMVVMRRLLRRQWQMSHQSEAEAEAEASRILLCPPLAEEELPEAMAEDTETHLQAVPLLARVAVAGAQAQTELWVRNQQTL